jgi:hypothetical protein
MPAQSYATHRRFDPVFHFVGFPLVLAFLVISAILLWKHPSLASAGQMVLAIALPLISLKIRLYALTVQDRLIRLEETLRMQRLLPEDLKARVPELKRNQFVGLRFAADAELAERMREALAENLGNEAIKKRIKGWRGDFFRV